MNLIRKLAVVIVALGSVSVAQADIINGSFEDGLAGWNSLGLTGVRGIVGPHAPTDGVLQGALEAGGTGTGGSDTNDEMISNVLGIPRVTVANPYAPPDIVQPTIFELLRQDFNGGLSGCYERPDDCLTINSSLLYQSFEAKAGQRITFDWNLLGIDVHTADSAYVTLTTPGSITAILLGDTKGNVVPIDPSFGSVELLCASPSPPPNPICDGNVLTIKNGATGYQSISLDIFSSGVATLGFSLIESAGVTPESGLLIDNVRLTKIPEPGTLALFGIGLIGMGLSRRKKI